VLEVLEKVWYIMCCICGKRLAPAALQEVVGCPQRYREIRIDLEVRNKLRTISAATID